MYVEFRACFSRRLLSLLVLDRRQIDVLVTWYMVDEGPGRVFCGVGLVRCAVRLHSYSYLVDR